MYDITYDVICDIIYHVQAQGREPNLWLWRYGRGQHQTMSIEEAEAARQNRVSEARKRAEETKKRSWEAAAREGAAAAE